MMHTLQQGVLFSTVLKYHISTKHVEDSASTSPSLQQTTFCFLLRQNENVIIIDYLIVTGCN